MVDVVVERRVQQLGVLLQSQKLTVDCFVGQSDREFLKTRNVTGCVPLLVATGSLGYNPNSH